MMRIYRRQMMVAVLMVALLNLAACDDQKVSDTPMPVENSSIETNESVEETTENEVADEVELMPSEPQIIGDDGEYDYYAETPDGNKVGLHLPKDIIIKEIDGVPCMCIKEDIPQYGDMLIAEIHTGDRLDLVGMLRDKDAKEVALVATPIGKFKEVVITGYDKNYDRKISYLSLPGEEYISFEFPGYYVNNDFCHECASLFLETHSFVKSLVDKDADAYDFAFLDTVIYFKDTFRYEDYINSRNLAEVSPKTETKDQDKVDDVLSDESKKDSGSKTMAGGYVLLADGTKVMPGGSISLSDFDAAVFIVSTGNTEQLWYTAVACLGPYYMAEDPEVNWAYEGKVAADGSIPLSMYKGIMQYDPVYDYLAIEMRGVNSMTDYELNFHVNK